jgi:hypothetical protein
MGNGGWKRVKKKGERSDASALPKTSAVPRRRFHLSRVSITSLKIKPLQFLPLDLPRPTRAEHRLTAASPKAGAVAGNAGQFAPLIAGLISAIFPISARNTGAYRCIFAPVFPTLFWFSMIKRLLLLLLFACTLRPAAAQNPATDESLASQQFKQRLRGQYLRNDTVQAIINLYGRRQAGGVGWMVAAGLSALRFSLGGR